VVGSDDAERDWVINGSPDWNGKWQSSGTA
jgi:hypothetical protein